MIYIIPDVDVIPEIEIKKEPYSLIKKKKKKKN